MISQFTKNTKYKSRGCRTFIMNWALSRVIFLNRSISQMYLGILAPDFVENRQFFWGFNKKCLQIWSIGQIKKNQNTQFIIKAPRPLLDRQILIFQLHFVYDFVVQHLHWWDHYFKRRNLIWSLHTDCIFS